MAKPTTRERCRYTRAQWAIDVPEWGSLEWAEAMRSGEVCGRPAGHEGDHEWVPREGREAA